MDEGFWQRRWAKNEIGFHQQAINAYLQHYWPRVAAAPSEQVLVPLCGKSLDMLWLLEQGQRVLGVELSQKAVEDFFAERGWQAQVEQRGVFQVYRHAALEIYCGDFFALSAEEVAGCSLLFDRAALIALPPSMRERYAAHLSEILPDGCRGLLVSLEYPQAHMDGPPFSVPQAEVERLMGRWRPQLLERLDVLGENARFAERGLSQLDEAVYGLGLPA